MIHWATRISIIITCAFIAWMFAGCSASTEEEVVEDTPAAEAEVVEKREDVDVLYERALTLFTQNRFDDALEAFEDVERQHPYSVWAKRAQVMAAYSAYRNQDYDSSQIILERFVKLHPNNPSTPYAYYLRALNYYDQISDVGRDQKMTENARQALREVVSRYPDSDYARDARLKLDLTQDHLAGKEMQIGRYYQGRQEYLAAVNRFKFVVDHYQTTSHIPEALHRLVETYLLLGVKPEAKKYAAVLGHNYPGSPWYEFSYAMLDGDVDPENSDKGEEGFWGGLIPSL